MGLRRDRLYSIAIITSDDFSTAWTFEVSRSAPEMR